MQDITSKVAVITGGGSGIGRGIARALSAEGVRIVLADIDLDRATAVADELTSQGAEALAVRCDVADRADVEALADFSWNRFGQVDLVFNNAGVGGPVGPAVEIDEGVAQSVMGVNFYGVLNGCTVFGPRLIDQGTPAHICNTGSENSLSAPILGMAVYTASKHAVLGYSDVLRQELPSHIGLSVLCPGIVASKLTGSDGDQSPDIGMGSDECGLRAVDGIKSGAFYIVTHAPVSQFVDERYAEQADAFRTQAPRFKGDDHLDTRKAVSRLSQREQDPADK